MKEKIGKLALKVYPTLSALIVTSLALFPAAVTAQSQIEFTPSLSINETYDDNINLDSSNKESDYITSISPHFNLNVQSQNSSLMFSYAPSFVRYKEKSENDTIRHSGNINFDRELGQYLKLNISDTFIKSEEPIEETEDIQTERKDRNPYWRNNGNASLRYTFGPENSLSLGYGQSRLENDDVTIDDSLIHNANSALTYWFNEKHGFETNVSYVSADFWNDGGLKAGDDYDGYGFGMKYLHHFNPHSTGFIGYSYNTRDFEGDSEDYDIHDGNIGIDYSFSPNTSLSASVGYFIKKPDQSDNDSGLSYNISLLKQFQRGSVTLDGRGGWNESYQDAERTGFTKYWSAGATVQYQIAESVSTNAGARFRKDEDDQNNQKWNTLRGNIGLSWSFMQWFSLSLTYSYAERNDDVDTEDYTDNKVMVSLSGSRLFRW